jgi:hypothetical protein
MRSNATGILTEKIDLELGKKEPQNVLKDFWRDYCGITEDGYRYTYGAQSGRMINFFRNRLFKNISDIRGGESEKDPTASTREALYVEYDKYAPQKERDNAVARELPDGKDTKIRAKRIKYGNHNAMWEVMSGHLYRLTGLSAPDSRMMICEDYEEDKIPDVYVASPMITGYYDLGNFLIDETVITAFIDDEEKLEIWRLEKAKIDEITRKSTRGESIDGADKIARIKATGKIYNLLPQYVHNEIEKSFAAGKFIGNWDFANFNLNNIGVKFTFDRERKVASFESVFVDFGNSGRSGFGGEGKKQSEHRANSEAKKLTAESKDSDPALVFTEIELNFIQRSRSSLQEDELAEIKKVENDLEMGNINQTDREKRLDKINEKYFNKAVNKIAKELADNEESKGVNLPDDEVNFRRSIIFKAVHHIRPQEASLEIDASTMGLLTISDLPRNLPFGVLFESALKAKTQAALKIIRETNIDLSDADQDLSLRSLPQISSEASIYRDSEIEMAFRLSLITNQAIDKVVKNWYLYEEFPDVFAPTNASEDDHEYESCDQIAEIFKKRRDVLVASIPQEVIDGWVARNKPWAIAAQESVNLMILKETRDCDPDFEEKYPFEPISGDASPQKASSLSLSRKSSNKLFTPSNSQDNVLETSDYESSTSSSLEERMRVIEERNSFEARMGRSAYVGSSAELPAKTILDLTKSLLLSEDTATTAKIDRLSAKLLSAEDVEDRDFIVEKIDTLQTEQGLKKITEVLHFISDNIDKWKRDLGLHLRPDCKLFDLNCCGEAYQTQNRDDLAIAHDQTLTQKENLTRNKKILAEDLFVCNRLVKNLDLCTSHGPTTILKDAHISPTQSFTLQIS